MDHVSACLIWLWQANPPKTDADRHAWALARAGLGRFGAFVDVHEDITDFRLAAACRALEGGPKGHRALYALRYVEAVLAGAAHVGERFAGFGEAARLTCEHFGRSAADAPELAAMLANVVEQRGRGRLPRGNLPPEMIAAWLSRDDRGTRATLRVSRARKKK